MQEWQASNVCTDTDAPLDWTGLGALRLWREVGALTGSWESAGPGRHLARSPRSGCCSGLCGGGEGGGGVSMLVTSLTSVNAVFLRIEVRKIIVGYTSIQSLLVMHTWNPLKIGNKHFKIAFQVVLMFSELEQTLRGATTSTIPNCTLLSTHTPDWDAALV